MKKITCSALSVLLLLASFSMQAFAEDLQDDIVTAENIISSEEQTTNTEPIINDEPTEPQEISDIGDIDEPDLYEPEIEYIPVEDIELSEFNSEMYVDETQNLSATVIPQNASEQIVRYSSSNSDVATVNQLGKLTAVGKGTCQIYVTCDGLSVYYDLKVKVKTESINVKSKFIVIKPDQKYNLEPSVQPVDASQELTFKSKDVSIAVIDDSGVITAKSPGSTSIIVANEDATILVNVVVSTESDDYNVNETMNDKNTNAKNDIDTLTEQIRKSSDSKIVVKDTGKITASALKELFGTEKELIVECTDYDISIRGQDIFNANNEITTKLNFTSVKKGTLVKINNGKNLPGTITIKLKNFDEDFKYFYLVDENNNEYHKLNSLSNNEFKINSLGEYLLSIKEIKHFKINILWVLGGIGIILFITIIYIFTKKKYWFW